jgi:hypothetical protein
MGRSLIVPTLLRFDFPQMNLFGFTDSLGTHEPDECPHCRSVLRLASGLCLRCLLQAGLTEDKEASGEQLEVLLSEIE